MMMMRWEEMELKKFAKMGIFFVEFFWNQSLLFCFKLKAPSVHSIALLASNLGALSA